MTSQSSYVYFSFFPKFSFFPENKFSLMDCKLTYFLASARGLSMDRFDEFRFNHG
jgi:hypothetical protein